MKIQVSVIIPNYNGLDFLKICLPSLKRQTFKNLEIILIDNGSSDESLKFVKKDFPEVIYIKLTKNLGFSKAVNLGIKKSKGKYIVLLNNDTKVDKRCIQFLIEAAINHKDVGFISAKILNFDKKNLIDNAGDYIDSVGHLYSRGLGQKDGPKFNEGEYIFLGTGSGTLFKKELFEKIGFFDEDFFFYMEDADLSFRAQLAGFKGWFEPKAIIYHKRAGSASKNPSVFEPMVFRNMTELVLKDFSGSLFFGNLNWLKIILVHLNTLKYLFSKGYFLQTAAAEWYLITNLGRILRKRKRVQKLKVVRDSYIKKNIKIKKFTAGRLFFW